MLRHLALFTAAMLSSSVVSVAQVRYQPEPAPAQFRGKLDQAVGRSIYACYRTGLIVLDTREQDGRPALYYGAAANPARLHYMVPWKVVGIDQLNDLAGWPVFGLRILVDGSVMVVNGIAVSPSEIESSHDLLQTLADKANLFTSVEASGIRFTDLQAVQTGEIHSGMSEQEVECALGPPQRSWPDDAGESRNFYDGGRLVVSVAGGRVVKVAREQERAAR
jgi:hypothetical protein